MISVEEFAEHPLLQLAVSLSSCSDFMTSGDKLEQTECLSICNVDGFSR